MRNVFLLLGLFVSIGASAMKISCDVTSGELNRAAAKDMQASGNVEVVPDDFKPVSITFQKPKDKDLPVPLSYYSIDFRRPVDGSDRFSVTIAADTLKGTRVSNITTVPRLSKDMVFNLRVLLDYDTALREYRRSKDKKVLSESTAEVVCALE